MLFSAARKHKVVSTTSAETLAKVSGFVVDATERKVIAVTVKGSKSGKVVEWPSITAFGSDALTVESESAITASSERIRALGGKANTMMGKRVLSTDGDSQGEVSDVEFDGETGDISFVMVDGAPVTAERLVGVGSYAVVIRSA